VAVDQRRLALGVDGDDAAGEWVAPGRGLAVASGDRDKQRHERYCTCFCVALKGQAEHAAKAGSSLRSE